MRWRLAPGTWHTHLPLLQGQAKHPLHSATHAPACQHAWRRMHRAARCSNALRCSGACAHAGTALPVPVRGVPVPGPATAPAPGSPAAGPPGPGAAPVPALTPVPAPAPEAAVPGPDLAPGPALGPGGVLEVVPAAAELPACPLFLPGSSGGSSAAKQESAFPCRPRPAPGQAPTPGMSRVLQAAGVAATHSGVIACF